MNIIFYKNRSQKNVKNKILLSEKQVVGHLKGEMSIENPTIDFNFDVSLTQYNYAYIPDLQRYYFIDSFIFNNKTITVSFRVDVLTSADLTQVEVIAERSSNRFNKNIADSVAIMTRKKILNYSRLPFQFTPTDGSGSYVLTVSGK